MIIIVYYMKMKLVKFIKRPINYYNKYKKNKHFILKGVEV